MQQKLFVTLIQKRTIHYIWWHIQYVALQFPFIPSVVHRVPNVLQHGSNPVHKAISSVKTWSAKIEVVELNPVMCLRLINALGAEYANPYSCASTFSEKPSQKSGGCYKKELKKPSVTSPLQTVFWRVVLKLDCGSSGHQELTKARSIQKWANGRNELSMGFGANMPIYPSYYKLA